MHFARSPVDCLVGVPLEEGVELLRRLVGQVLWRGRSTFLVAGCEDILTMEGDSQPGHPAVAMAFEPDPATVAWAAEHSARLLLPPANVVDAASDKVNLIGIAEAAGVKTAPATVLRPAKESDSDRLWRSASGPLVLQRRPNNLTGDGTLLATTAAQLRDGLREWTGQVLKVCAFVPGLNLTISGCVSNDRALASGISHQIVGIAPLTTAWGRHCGNQLLGSSDLPAGMATACLETARAVGEQLRQRGFRGSFGLDAVAADSGDIVVIEINARLQSVTSLLSTAERTAGLLPLAATHVLAFLLDTLPAAQTGTSTAGQLSQLVLYAGREMTVGADPLVGRLAGVQGRGPASNARRPRRPARPSRR